MQKWNCKNAWTAEFEDSSRKNGYSQLDKERVEQSVEPHVSIALATLKPPDICTPKLGRQGEIEGELSGKRIFEKRKGEREYVQSIIG